MIQHAVHQYGQHEADDQRKQRHIIAAGVQPRDLPDVRPEIKKEKHTANDAITEQRIEIDAMRMRSFSAIILLIKDLIALRAAAKPEMVPYRLQCRAPDAAAHDEGIQKAAARQQAGIQKHRRGPAADQTGAERE